MAGSCHSPGFFCFTLRNVAKLFESDSEGFRGDVGNEITIPETDLERFQGGWSLGVDAWLEGDIGIEV